jgi:PKD-like domain
MSKTPFSKHLRRALGLITLGFTLVTVAPANRVTTVPFPLASPAVSPTPEPAPEAKRPHPVRRFFSAIADGIVGVFRRPKPFYCRLPPVIYLTSSSSSIAVCPTAQHSLNPSCSSSGEVTLTADAMSADNKDLLFTWTVPAGRLRDEGSKVTWDLSGRPEGAYTATVEVNDGNQHTATALITVQVTHCSDCVWRESPCPTVSVSCPADIGSKQTLTFIADVAGGFPPTTPTYQWSLPAGKIISGQGTSTLGVDVSELAGQSITATVSIDGFDPRCKKISVASCTTEVGQ